MSCLSKSRFVVYVSVAFVAFLACATAAGQVVVSTNFEDGQTDGWTTVTNGAWVKMVGAFTPATNATSLLIYVEGSSATSSYYIDDFTVAVSNGGCSNPPDNSGFV